MKTIICLFLLLAGIAHGAPVMPFSYLKGVVGGGGGGGFAQIQSATYAASADSTTGTLTWTSAPTAGSRLIVAVCSGGTIATPPSGWTQDQTTTSYPAVGAYIYSKVAGASEPTTVTFTQNAAAMMTIVGVEYSGMVGTGGVDQGANNLGSGSVGSVSTGTTATTTSATDLVVAVSCSPGDNSALNDGLVTVSSWTAGFTTVATVHSTGTSPSGSVLISMAVQSVSAVGTYSATATFSNTCGNPGGLIVAYKKS